MQAQAVGYEGTVGAGYDVGTGSYQLLYTLLQITEVG